MTHSQHKRDRSRSRSRSRSREREKYCEWTGKLEQLSDHIKKCKFEVIRCKDCDECIERGMQREHSLECELCAIECPKCKQMVARIHMDRHKERECLFEMVKCGNCGKETERSDIERHYNECPEAIVSCRFYQFGCCEGSIKRKHLKKHMADNANEHLMQMTNAHSKLQCKFNDLSEEHNELKTDHERLKQTVRNTNEETSQRLNNIEQMLYSGLPNRNYRGY